MPIRILRPQTDGSLADITRQLLGNGPLPGAVASSMIVEGDFNEDGRVDLFVACGGWDANPFPGEVNVLLLSKSDGTYRDASVNLPQQPDFTHSAAVGDINGDRHLDIYVGNISGQQSIGPYFLRGNGDGTFIKVTSGLPATITSLTEKFTACGLVDIDSDGATDLVLGTHGDAGFLDSVILFNDGSGNFTVRPRLVLPAGPLGRGNTVVQGVGVLDINHDGKPDLILPSSQYSTFTGLGLQILINRGGGVLADESVARLGSHAARFTHSPYQAPRFADLNGDGLTDFYFANGPVEPVPRYFIAEPGGTFASVPPSGPDALPPGLGFGVTALHFDGDGLVDLVQVSHNGDGDIVYQSFLNRTREPPLVSSPPAGQTIVAGASSSFSVTATGAPPLSYQWKKDGANISGATGPTLSLPTVSSADAGTYTIIVSNPAGSVERSWTLSVIPSAYLANLSVRAAMAVGQTLIVGFVVEGGSKPVLVRAAGPVLNQYGLTGVTDPSLTLFKGSEVVAANNDWDVSLATTFATLGAFPFDAGSKDAALLQAINGPHTVQATAGSPGTILVEAYDAGPNDVRKLVNLSARFHVGTGDNILIAGFVVSGTGTRQLLVRAVGPTLAAYGVSGALVDPQFTVFEAGTRLAGNDNWAPELTATFGDVGAFRLSDGSRDAASLVTLNAGKAYTVQVTGVGGATGEALVELYLIP